MGGEGAERRSKKEKGKRQEEKAESGSRGDGEAVKLDLATDSLSNSKGKVAMDVEEAKEMPRRKKRKEKEKEKGHGKEKKNKVIADNIEEACAEAEQAEASGLKVEQHCSEHVQGDMSKCGSEEDKSIKKDNKLMMKKKKKKERKVEMAEEGQILAGSTDENAGLLHAEMGRGEKEQGKKSKKSKRKHEDGEPVADGSAGDEIMTNRDKKRRRKEQSVELKEGDQVNISKKAVKIKGNKKRKNESDKFNPDLSTDALTGEDKVGGDGKNDKRKKKNDTSTRRNEVGRDDKNDKKKKKSKEGNGGRKGEKEKAAQSKDKVRRVSFSDAVEVFSINDGEDEDNGKSAESEVVHGKRFTPEENATLMEAIMSYIEMKQLGENGLEMIRACSKHPELKGCWAEIGKSLPHRPLTAIYKRARILLYRSDERKWTPEEYEKIRRHVEKNGTSWISLAQELGKSEIHLKDTWRRIKPKNLKSVARFCISIKWKDSLQSQWTQDEYQNLFDLVNLDLRVKAHQEYDAGNRKLRDNIAWEAISDKLTTRNHKNCCLKWYYQLASPLVQKGIWADTDDYRLVEALQNVDAVCVEDIDWDNLLDHRSGEVCRQRWNEMVRYLGGHKEKPFIEQVEVLSKRYCPEMVDYREGEA
uniref:Myb-like domain-containing protein n=1 Tax=Oryza barthii TaxID=65489 RepID=A0A0D3GFQ9_9ORYZ